MKLYRVSDTITIERVWYVDALNEHDAWDRVESGEIEADHEEQSDNTPYEIEEYDGTLTQKDADEQQER